jgi:hypothetical protein
MLYGWGMTYVCSNMCEGLDLFSSAKGIEIVFYAGTLCAGESLIGGEKSVLFVIKHIKYLKVRILVYCKYDRKGPVPPAAQCGTFCH